MIFHYKKFPLPKKSTFFGTTLLKPVIPIGMVWKDQFIQYDALIDSGADFCIFDAEIAEYLGINIKKGESLYFGGIQDTGNKSAIAYMHHVELTVGGHSFISLVGFSEEITKQGFGVLGQKGFFDYFKIKFDLTKEEIDLTPKSKNKIK